MADQETATLLTAEEAKPKKRFRKRFVIIPTVLILLWVGCWWMVGEMLGYTTYSRMQSKCAKAHTFANICMEWEKEGNTLTSGIWQIKPGESDFVDYILLYNSNAEGEWFGLVLDGDGEIVYALNCFVEIPEQYLGSPPDYDEQMALLDSHFASKRQKAVGVWYTDDTKNTMND